MNFLLPYLLKVSLALLPFYGLYLLAMRRLTFFRWNRWYLVSSLLACALIPLVHLPSGGSIAPYLPPQKIDLTVAAGTAATTSPTIAAAVTNPSYWLLLLVMIYCTGVLISFCRFLVSLSRVMYLVNSHQTISWQGYRVIKNNDVHTNASFFRYIFLQPALTPEEEAAVMVHESIHARQWHSADILLLETFKVLLWFNPVLHHYKKLLQQAHEFEVDHETTLTTSKKSYAHFLLKLQQPPVRAVVNLYSSSGTAQRIKMLFKERSGNRLKLFYLLLVPCLLLATVYCSKQTADVRHNGADLSSMQFTDKYRDTPEHATMLSTGKQLFVANCAACHNIDKDLTGPALTGIENRRSKAWIYAFTRNSQDLLAKGDSQALKIYNEWGKVPMNTFSHLTDADIDAMLAYIKNGDTWR